ncbi:MAG: peptidoglycan-binding domain-containing protein [Candidatus Paceibacterota bacterium]|jgi:hypothetical protein
MTKLTTLKIAAVFALCIPAVASADTLYRPLSIGMSGTDVSSLQTFLARDVSIYPQGLVTGYFGVLTKAAVANFQARNGISAVGRVGPITLPVINAQMSGGNVVGYDRTAPSISSLSVSIDRNNATLSWDTNEHASAIVYYSTYPISMTEAGAGSAVTISGTSLLVHTDVRTSHSTTLIGLQSNTRYYYVVYVKDVSGNESVTPVSSFQTSN